MVKKNLFLIFILLIIASCSSDINITMEEDKDTYDRSAMLTNLADNIIIPAFQDLDAKLSTLTTAKDDFIAASNQSNLDELRASWLNAYKVFQYVEMLNIGKAEDIQYSFQMNVYPTNIDEIESNISSGTYDLTHVNNFDAIGFPALDYLLFGMENTDATILDKYTTNADATNYKKYLSDIVDQMDGLTKTVLNDWTSTNRNIFIESSSNTASSSVNKLVNDYIFYYEKGLRVNKIGTPAGIYSTTPLPEKVEAFYNKNVSKELALEGLQAAQDFFNGKHYNSATKGEGLHSYLKNLDKSELSNSINIKLDAARQQMQLLNDNFYTQINDDNTKMTQTFDALQAVVVLLKVEMLNEFNISVDYVDADGD